MLASSPVASLNHKISPNGIPPDSISIRSTLVALSATAIAAANMALLDTPNARRSRHRTLGR